MAIFLYNTSDDSSFSNLLLLPSTASSLFLSAKSLEETKYFSTSSSLWGLISIANVGIGTSVGAETFSSAS